MGRPVETLAGNGTTQKETFQLPWLWHDVARMNLVRGTLLQSTKTSVEITYANIIDYTEIYYFMGVGFV